MLNPEDLPSKAVKGGQEHDLWHEETTDRYWKLTKNGVFGLSPGVEMALVSSAEDEAFLQAEAKRLGFQGRRHSKEHTHFLESEESAEFHLEISECIP